MLHFKRKEKERYIQAPNECVFHFLLLSSLLDIEVLNCSQHQVFLTAAKAVSKKHFVALNTKKIGEIAATESL